MTGVTCAVNIEELSAGLKDVSKARINFVIDTAHVEYDPEKISLTVLKHMVNESVTMGSTGRSLTRSAG